MPRFFHCAPLAALVFVAIAPAAPVPRHLNPPVYYFPTKVGAKLVSHVNTKLWMTQEIPHDWENKVYPPRAKTALPTETFYTTGKMDFGGEPIEYGIMPMAHTDGDIYVYFTKSNVLMTGDAVQPGRLPLLDWRCDGWLGGMQDAHRTLLRVANDTTKIVPGGK